MGIRMGMGIRPRPWLGTGPLLAVALAFQAGIASGQQIDSVAFPVDGVTIRGRLFRPGPPGAVASPAVVFLHGGGRLHLNSEPEYFAELLLEEGIASLVYDKRGTGASGGDWSSADFERFVLDGQAAVRFLGRQPGIDAGKIAVVGFSQGGRLAPAVAAGTNAAAAVSVSGPFVSVPDTRLHALENSFRELGLTESEAGGALSLWSRYLSLLSEGRPVDALDQEIFTAARTMDTRALPSPSEYFQPAPIFNSMGFDTGAGPRTLSVPFLALFGAEDITVPVEASVERLRAHFDFTSGGSSLVIIPGVDHSFSNATGNRHPTYPETVRSWLRRHIGG